MLKGQCLCGAVRWEFDDSGAMTVHCHCSMCRRHHGTSFATFTAGPADALRLLAGAADVQTYKSSANAERHFCRHCGSKVPGAVGSDMSAVPTGQAEDGANLRPLLHMFAASRAPWYEITDDLPQHATYPVEWGMGDGVATEAADSPAAQSGVVSGRCLCGDVAFELHGAPRNMYNCHCQRCRRARGAAHATNVFYPESALRWRRGADRIGQYALPGARSFGTAFCRRCGGFTPRVIAARGAVSVPVGTLDGDPGMRPQAHIYVGSKAAWFDITDRIPRFEEMPPT